jgi:Rrf2 family protein
MGIRPSSRFSYALKALVDLAVHQGTGPVTIASIAKRQSIPAQSLEQLFNRLRRSGLVEAERGPRGGYSLNRPPEKIRVREIFEALEPKALSPKKRLAVSPDDPVRSVWKQVESAVKTTLEATTLEALTAQMREKVAAPMKHRYTFHI